MEVVLHVENQHHYQHMIKKMKSFANAKLFTNLTISLENVSFEHSVHYLLFSAFCNINLDHGLIIQNEQKKNYQLTLQQDPEVVSSIIELLYTGTTNVHLAKMKHLKELAQQLHLLISTHIENEEFINIVIMSHKDILLNYIWNDRRISANCDLVFITNDFKQNVAHKEVFAVYSKYFENMYKARLDLSRPLVLVLQNVENENLELLLEYCYKGSIKFTQTNIERLNNISKLFGMQLALDVSNIGINYNRTEKNSKNNDNDMICIGRPPAKPRPIIVELINNNKNYGNCYIWQEQKCIMVHAIVMKTFSPFLKKIYEFIDWNVRDVAVIINTFSYMELKAIIDFIYTGETNLVVDQLGIGTELFHWLGLSLSDNPGHNDNRQYYKMDPQNRETENTIKNEVTHREGESCIPSTTDEKKENNDYKNKYNFVCNECEMDFKSERSLKIHMKTHYTEIYRCKHCGKVFLKRCNLKRHENIHKKSEHQCEIHGNCFGNKDYPVEHKRNHSGDKPFICPICFKRFTGKPGLNHHTRTHDKKKSILFVCDICGKKFTRQGLWGHMKTHKKEYSCEICNDKSFATPSALKRHIKWVHEKHPPLKCNFCKEEYEQKSQLDRHMINAHYYYNGEFIHRKKYACNKCSQSFHTSIRLQKHMANRHSGKDLLQCNICGKLLSGSSAIKYHMRAHTGERPHLCSFCPKTFTRPDLLKKHIRIHTGERFICPVCKKSFTSKHYLTEHSWTHNISIDPEQYKTEAKLPEDITILSVNSIDKSKYTFLKDYPREYLHKKKIDNTLKSSSLQLIDDMILKNNVYHCMSCECTFPSNSSLKDHYSSCLISKASHLCSNCEILFDTREELNSHYLYCQPIF